MYHDPISGQDMNAPTGWKNYEPDKPAVACGPIEPKGIVLLTAEDQMAQRIGLPELLKVVTAIYESVFGLHAITGVLPPAGQTHKLLVDVTLRGERPNLANLYEVRAEPPLPEKARAELDRRLDAVPRPMIHGSEVHLQLTFELRAPRSGEPKCKLPGAS